MENTNQEFGKEFEPNYLPEEKIYEGSDFNDYSDQMKIPIGGKLSLRSMEDEQDLIDMIEILSF